MKKIIILIVVLGACNDIFAFTTIGNWRWRKDDGTQTTATWVAAQNTAPVISISDTSETFRLRIELFNDSTNVDGGGALKDAILMDSSNAPGSTWDTIKVTADIDDAFVLAGSSPNVTDLEATTQQLTSPHYRVFQAGKIIVSTEKLPASTVGDNGGTEYEYAIKPTANLLPGITYYFRVWAVELTDTIPLPTLTTAAVLPIQLSGFVVNRINEKIKIQWMTTSEQNNDRFEVQRSSNGRTWQTIANVKGNGTSAGSNTYTIYDESPLAGSNYYVVKQYDADGRSFLSDVRFLRAGKDGKIMLSVSPNPAHSEIKFSIGENALSNVEAILTNINGRVIHRETIKTVQANAFNKLSLRQQPAPGVYFLKLKSKGLSESVKIVVE